MELDKIGGLPLHPMLVHLSVVGIPFVALLVVAFVAVPRWRQGLLYPLAGLTVLVTLGTILVASSGESLEELLPPDDRASALLQRHTELGEQTEMIMIVFGGVTLALLALHWYRRRRGEGAGLGPVGPNTLAKLVVPLGIAAMLLGSLAIVWDVRTGHAGARSVWHDSVQSQQADATGTGDSDEDSD